MHAEKECDLCGLGCGRHPLCERVGDAENFFCCSGCLNVYLILWESGVIRSGQDIRQTEIFQRSLQLGLISNRSKEDGRSDASCEGSQELLLRVSGMWCTSCAWLIEHALEALPGVTQTEASFACDLVKVRYAPQVLPRERITERIASLGYRAADVSSDTDVAQADRRDLIIRAGLAAFLWANVMSFSLVLYAGYFEQISGSIRHGLPFVLMALSTPVVFYCAFPILRMAWRGVLNGTIRMEALLSIGILSAYGYSVLQALRGEIHLYFDTATVIVTLVLAGKLIETSAKERASRWITELHRMMPNKVRILAKGLERFVSIEALQEGHSFVVKAGERIPADGHVLDGESHADESLLTGESSPVTKMSGDDVVAGSINLDGVLTVQATKAASDSTLSRILALVEQALSGRSDLERAVDRVSRVFVPSVVALAAITFLFRWQFSGAGITAALMRAVTVLVIACPCALGLATPLAITAALGIASRRGILVRDSRVLETIRSVRTVILDKTGTVTEGKFALLNVVELPVRKELATASVSGGGERFLEGEDKLCSPFERENSLSLLASLEQYSEHPLGEAVMRAATLEHAQIRDAADIEIHKGCGITGTMDGARVFAGNRRLLHEMGIELGPELIHAADRHESEGKTTCFFGIEGEVRGLAVFGDRLREEAADVIRQLRHRGIEVRLLSGDSKATTRWTATALGVEAYEAEVMPEHKIEWVRRLQQQGATVAMVGDGINDAPALAQADLGIAVSSAADVAISAAAVVLMNGGLHKITETFDLSRRSLRVVRQNLFWAFFYNVVGITLAVAGVLNPLMAAVAMLLSSVSVVGNSMRLARQPTVKRS